LPGGVLIAAEVKGKSEKPIEIRTPIVAGDLIALERAIGSVQSFRDLKPGVRSAGWKPAIQQVENLRYFQILTSDTTSANLM